MKFITYNSKEVKIDVFSDKTTLSKHIGLSTTTINSRLRDYDDYFYHSNFIIFFNPTIHKDGRGGTNNLKKGSESNFKK